MNAQTSLRKLSGVRHVRSVCAGVIALLMVSPVAAKTVEEIQKELIEKGGKLKSYTAKIATKMDIDYGQGNKMKSESGGTMEWISKETPNGVKVLYRTESKDTSTSTFDGKESKTISKSLVICDGDFLYSLNDTDGQKMAVKMKMEPTKSHNIKVVFKSWEQNYDLKILPDEQFEEKSCYVIEATPKKKNMGKGDKSAPEQQANSSPIVKYQYWYRKDIGLMVKLVGFDKNNKPTMINTTSDIKVNAEIKPERFKFKVPEGVTLVDMTKQEQPKSEETSSKTTPQQESKVTEKEPDDKPEKKVRKGLKGLFDKLK